MSGQRGFTLIEIMLATALMAAGMALAFATLRTAIGSVARAEQLAAHTEQTRAAQRFLRRQISAALPMAFDRDPRTGYGPTVAGDADQLRFVASMPGHLSFGGPHLQLVEFVSDADRGLPGYRLQFDYRLLVGESVLDTGDERPPVVLVDGIAEGGFEFRGMGPDGEIGDWQPVWEGTGPMPLLVRLNLEFIDERRFWPPLAMPLPLAQSARFDDDLIPGPRPQNQEGE